MNRKTGLYFRKYAGYALLMVLLYVMQTTPRFLDVFGVKPNLVIPAAVCIAMLENEFIGGFYGALAGALCDLGGFTIFGFNAIILLAGCVLIGLLVIYMLRVSMPNFIGLLTGLLLTRGLLDYLLSYVMWGYENVWMVLAYDIVPGIIYTAAVSPLIFYLYRRIFRRYEERLQA